MNEFTPEELEQSTKQMFIHGGTPNVLEAIIAMAGVQIVILKSLIDILKNERIK